MSIRTKCPQCHHAYRVDSGLIGKSVNCRHCKTKFTVLEPAARPNAAPKLESGECPGCKSELPAGSVICIHCGGDLRTGQRVTRQEDSPRRPGNEGGSRAWRWIVGLGDRFLRADAGTQRLVVGLLCLVVIVCTGLGVSSWISAAAYSHGRPAHDWVLDLGKNDRAETALRELKERAVPALVRGLKSESLVARAKSAELLGRLGPRAAVAVGPLTVALSDNSGGLRNKDRAVCDASAEALGNIGEAARSSIPALVKLVESKKGRTPNDPIGAIGKIGGSQAEDALVELLKPQALEVAALRQRKGDASEFTRLYQKLTGQDAKWRQALVVGLGAMRAKTAVPQLRELLGDPVPAIRNDALVALDLIGVSSPELIVGVVENTTAQQPEAVRKSAIKLLTRCGSDPEQSQRVVAVLTELLADPVVMGAAAEALGRIGAPAAPSLEALIQAQSKLADLAKQDFQASMNKVVLTEQVVTTSQGEVLSRTPPEAIEKQRASFSELYSRQTDARWAAVKQQFESAISTLKAAGDKK